MDKNSFAHALEHPGTLTPDEWEALRHEKERYPFSAPLQVMSLLADKANRGPGCPRRPPAACRRSQAPAARKLRCVEGD